MKRKLLFIMNYCPLQNEIQHFTDGYFHMFSYASNSSLTIQVPDVFNIHTQTFLTNHNS
jgi:hypothetical protein